MVVEDIGDGWRSMCKLQYEISNNNNNIDGHNDNSSGHKRKRGAKSSSSSKPKPVGSKEVNKEIVDEKNLLVLKKSMATFQAQKK